VARLKRWLTAARNDLAIIWMIEPRLFLWPLILLVFAIGFFIVPKADAASIPTAAEQHRRTLVRAAHAEWGLAACRTFPLAGRIAHRSWNLTV
jgi:hypothetical protein